MLKKLSIALWGALALLPVSAALAGPEGEPPQQEFPASAPATEADLPPEPFAIEQTQRVLWHEDGAEIGARQWGAIDEADGGVTIAETVATQYWDRIAKFKGLNESDMPYQNRAYSWRSRVTCSPDHAVIHGVVETRLAGWPIMNVEAHVEGGHCQVTGTLWRNQDGARLDPPTQLQEDIAVPASGPVIFQSTLANAGPKLMTAPGQMNIVFAEFPDDFDEPVLFKEYRLVRSEREGGGFALWVVDAQEEGKVRIEFDANGNVLEEEIGHVVYIP